MDKLKGSLPSEIGLLGNLGAFSYPLASIIAPNFVLLTQFFLSERMYVTNTRIYGTLPSEIGSLSSLGTFDLFILKFPKTRLGLTFNL